MTDITLYGKESSSFEYVKFCLSKNAEKAGIDLKINEVTSTDSLIENQIMSIPAVKVNGEVLVQGKQNINSFIKEVNKLILTKENYGEMKKIIVPVDFSEASKNAMAYAVHIARNLNGMIHLLHSFKPIVSDVNGSFAYDAELENIRKEQLQELEAQLKDNFLTGSQNQLAIKSQMETGFANDRIKEMAKKNKDSMIVIGSTGSTGSFKKIFGSVSLDVALNASQPVLIVPPSAEFNGLKKITYCSSNLGEDAFAMDQVVEMVKKFNAELHLVHVEDGQEYCTDSIVRLWSNFVPKDKIFYHPLENNDGLIEAINEFAENENVDLLIMNHQKGNILNRLFHRSQTRRMAINTKIPLLVLHNSIV